MDNSEWLFGHKGLKGRINIRKELRRLKYDPLEPLLHELAEEQYIILQNEFSRYREAYHFYYLSLEQ
jgi:hypothetical protein